MYIKSVEIKNFRNFKKVTVPLGSFSIVIGENDSGKSNFLDALRLPLSINSLYYRSKVLKLTDFNSETMKEFLELMKTKKDSIIEAIENKESLDFIISEIPVIEIKISIINPTNSYERALLKDWIDEDNEGDCYSLIYTYKPRKSIDVIEYLIDMLNEDDDVSEAIFPIEYYDYYITSSNNNKRVTNKKLSNLRVSTINAERDDFSESENKISNRLISDLLNKNLSNKDKSSIHIAYREFFDSIEKADSFKKAFSYLESAEYKNFEEFVKTIKLIPNFPDLKNIFSNITLGYGEEYLHQKGLGTRNFILLMILFCHYYTSKETFNLICVEEPESHLCVNKLNLLLDFIEKSIDVSNTLTQVILTSHNPKIINKLKLKNVIVLKENTAISFSKVNDKLTNYLAKRPNFDTLKLLFSKRVILVEGPTEEMFINTILKSKKEILSEIEIISVGHKGFKTYLEIWLCLNKDNKNAKIGIIRDFDNQPNAKDEHEEYDKKYQNVFVRTTQGYTFEDDLANVSENIKILARMYNLDEDSKEIAKYLKSKKADNMLELCYEISDEAINLKAPSHISEVIECLMK